MLKKSPLNQNGSQPSGRGQKSLDFSESVGNKKDQITYKEKESSTLQQHTSLDPIKSQTIQKSSEFSMYAEFADHYRELRE